MPHPRRPLAQDSNSERLAWAIEPFRHFAEFHGRAPRKEYWMFWALTWAVSFVVWGFEKVLHIDRTIGPWGPLSLLLTLVLLLPTVALAVRRLHDVDCSGWWLFLGLLPIIGWAVLIYLLAKKGSPRDNRFGPNAAPR